MQISALGYEEEWKELITSFGSGAELGNIILRPRLLAGVEIVASKKTIEHRGTDVILNVANTPLSNAGTANDLLRNAPKVSQDRNGGLSVLGKGQAVIYLDGQRVNTPGILSSLSAQEIQRVEILENPPARYEAAGNAVINIITRQHSLSGYKFGFLQEFGLGRYFRATTRANAYYKFDRLLLQGTYGYRPWTFGSYFRQTRQLIDNPQGEITDNQYWLKNSRSQHDFDLRLAYALTPQSSLKLQFSATDLGVEKLGRNLRDISRNEESQLQVSSLVTGPTRQRTKTANLLYETHFDSLGSNLQVAAQVSTFDFNRTEAIRQRFTPELLPELSRNSGNQNAIDVMSVQADYHKQWSSGVHWEAGLKTAKITNESGAQLTELSAEGATIALPDFTNTYRYHEAIHAAYSSLKFSLAGWNTVVGVRAEKATSKGYSGLGEMAPLFSRDFLDVFPSLSASKQLSETFSANFGYAYRINRPVFQDLNPYVLYVDTLVSLRGNPALLPEYSHSFTLGLQLQKWNLQLSYVHTNDKINQIYRSPDPANP
ncbi:MAG: outer membrane beta-barrel protein, partial [Bacteroidota bacterium]